MRKNIMRAAVLAFASVSMLAQTAYADNVVTAQSSERSGSVLNSSESSGQFTTNSNGTYSGIISQTGPVATKAYNEKGYLVIGFGNDDANGKSRVIGPGQSGDSQASEAAPTGSNSSSAAVSGVQNVTIDENVAKPSVSAEAAVLYDATTGQVLFEKNGDKAMYPASTTKLLTALIAAEKTDMNDTFTFNASAVDNLESGAATAGMKKGDSMKLEDAMYAMLLRSACEVANGIAEKVSGTQSAFAELMNQRAKELGCTGSNFTNASGLNSTTHYTTAKDMALITAAALNNAEVKKVLQTASYTLPATSSRSALTIKTSNKMAAGGSDSYAGYVGGKTGYTSKAGSCLAGEIEYNGHKLVAVVFKANKTQYKDSKALFDYGVKLIEGTAANSTAAASTTTKQTVNNNTSADNASAASGKWVDAGNGKKKYQKADGSYYTNEWLDLSGNTFFFGSDSIMCTGWKQFTNSDWYYFNPENGAMVSGKWVTQKNKSYYLQQDGTMAKNKVIDNKYRVDADGVYVEKVG